MTEIEILIEQLNRVKRLSYNDNNTLDDIVRKGKMALENIFPTKMYSHDIKYIKFSNHYVVSMPESTYIKDWDLGKNKIINLLDTAIQDYQLKSSKKKEIPREIYKERIVQVKDETAINDLKDEFRHYRQAVKNWALYSIFTFISIILIWIHFFFSNWTWYNDHDKKLGITLLLNLTIIIGLLNIPLRTKWLIWIPIVFAILTALFTII